MKIASVIIAILVALNCEAQTEVKLPNTVAGRSVSGQFQVYTPRFNTAIRPPAALLSDTNYLELDPVLLTFACERIKQALHRELGIAPNAAPWLGRIHLTIRRASVPDEPVYIVTEKLRSGWAYHMGFPQVVERQRYIRGLIDVLLLEQANRNSSGRSAEIPMWLREGLTQLLLTRPDIELTPSRTPWSKGLAAGPTVFDIRQVNPHKTTTESISQEELAGLKRVYWVDPLEGARRALRSRPPLTLEELSWPSNEQLEGKAGEVYRRSAQLFVSELLRMPNGRDNLRAMLDDLALRYNWQTAFFGAFKGQFSRQLDLEKWWALQVVYFTGQDPTRLWSLEESCERLDKLLRTPIEVRYSADELPARTDAPLQSVIRAWDPNHQFPALRAKVRELEMFRLRIATDIVPLTDEYRDVLNKYIQRRETKELADAARQRANRTLHPAAQEAIKQLNDLDTRRAAINVKEPKAPVASAQNAKANP